MKKECNLGFVNKKIKECCICSKHGEWIDYLEYTPAAIKHSIIVYTCPSCVENYSDQIKHFWLGMNFGFNDVKTSLPKLKMA